MTDTPPPHQPGDIKKGYVFTEQGTWAPVKPPKKKHTVRNVFLVALRAQPDWASLAARPSSAVPPTRSASPSRRTPTRPGGTDNPLTITEGKAFEVDGFNYAAGWKIGNDALGDLDVKGLKVTNNRDDKDSALVEIKVWKGTEVLALADCTTEPIGVGTTVTLSCISADKLPKTFDKITINDTF